jgi:hemoglobin
MPETPALCQSISYEQVQQVVRAFYAKLLRHPNMAPFFAHIDNFAGHEQRITDFWWISMGGKPAHPPRIDMIGKHFPLGIENEHLEIWLATFAETLGEQLPDAPAREWMGKALHIGGRLKQIVIDHQSPGLQIKDLRPDS